MKVGESSVAQIIITVLILTFTGCANVTDKKYNEQSMAEDLRSIKESGKMSDEDLKIIGGGMLLSKMGKFTLDGKTYAQILAELKAMKGDNRSAVVEQNKESSNVSQKALLEAAEVKVFEKGALDDDGKKWVRSNISFNNLRSKGIKTLSGSFYVTDKKGNLIYSFETLVDMPIEPYGTFKMSHDVEFGGTENEIIYVNTELSDLNFEWSPKKIEYQDGTTLSY